MSTVKLKRPHTGRIKVDNSCISQFYRYANFYSGDEVVRLIVQR
jgi:hypothetical protein